MPATAHLDALSVFAAVTATFIKQPADSSVFLHLLYIRELLDNQVLKALIWNDTRDMLADGLNKGAVSRKALLKALLQGEWKVEHSPVMKLSRNVKIEELLDDETVFKEAKEQLTAAAGG